LLINYEFFFARLLILFFFLFIEKNSICLAAWVRPKGNLLHIHSISLSSVDQIKSYNNSNSDSDLSDYKISSLSYNLYAMYGLTERISLGTNLISSYYQVTKLNQNQDRQLALNFIEFFARYKIYSNNFMSSSIQILTKFPGAYRNNPVIRETTIKNKEHEISGFVGFGATSNFYYYSDSSEQKSNFIVLQGYYRKQEQLPIDRVGFELVYGLHFSHNWMFMTKYHHFNQAYSKKYIAENNLNLDQFNTTDRIRYGVNDYNIMTFSLVNYLRQSQISAMEIGIFSEQQKFAGQNQLGQNAVGMLFALWFN
jgi:hypothetical protein